MDTLTTPISWSPQDILAVVMNGLLASAERAVLTRPRMSDVGGNLRPSAPAAYDQCEREFGDGRPTGRARWQATLSGACGMVRPATG